MKIQTISCERRGDDMIQINLQNRGLSYNYKFKH